MNANTYPSIFSYLSRFAELSYQQKQLIESYIEPVWVPRGEWLLKEGDSCGHIYFLTQGLIRTVVDYADTDVTVWVTLPDHFLSSAYSYVKKKPSIVGLQAISKSMVLRIPRSAVKFLYDEIPVLKDISLSILNEYYIDLERLYIFCLAQSARQRYANLHAYFPEHFLRVPLKYLASMMHVKPETLSRIRRIQQNNELDFETG